MIIITQLNKKYKYFNLITKLNKIQYINNYQKFYNCIQFYKNNLYYTENNIINNKFIIKYYSYNLLDYIICYNEYKHVVYTSYSKKGNRYY